MASTQIKAVALYENAGIDATAVFSGTEVSGREKENAVDWQEYTVFEVEAGTTTLTWTLDSAQPIDAVAIYHASMGAGIGATVEVEVNAGGWATIDTVVLDGSGHVRFLQFDTIGGATEIRWTFTVSGGSLLVRQLMAGLQLEMYKGQWSGISPGTLLSGIVKTNMISSSGALIGANVRRTVRQMEITLDMLSESWVRNEWAAFAEHMQGKPCVFSWNPTEWPREAVWAAATEIKAPSNSSIAPSMQVSMPLVVRG